MQGLRSRAQFYGEFFGALAVFAVIIIVLSLFSGLFPF
jgi:hypothetical protein